MNGLVITGTIFPHKEIHKATWTSLNGRIKNQIDHTMIAKEYRSSVMDTAVRRCRCGKRPLPRGDEARAEVEKKPKGNERSNKVGYVETSRGRDACQIQH